MVTPLPPLANTAKIHQLHASHSALIDYSNALDAAKSSNNYVNSTFAANTYVNIQLDTKAANSTVVSALATKAANSTVVSALATKAANSYVVTTFAANTYVNTQLDTKAANSTVVAALATKAANTYVNTQLDTKAANSTVVSALATKAANSYVNTNFAANSYVNTNFAANSYVNTNFLKNNVEDQTITGGARVTVNDLGVKSTGTVTPDPGDRPIQHYNANGAHTLAPGTNYGNYVLEITNGASAGAITTSGWDLVAGDTFDTTSGNKFVCQCFVTSNNSLLIVTAMQ